MANVAKCTLVSLQITCPFLSLSAALGLRYGARGFSLQWLLLLWSAGSAVEARGLSSCGSRALARRLSSCGARA